MTGATFWFLFALFLIMGVFFLLDDVTGNAGRIPKKKPRFKEHLGEPGEEPIPSWVKVMTPDPEKRRREEIATRPFKVPMQRETIGENDIRTWRAGKR